MQSLLTIGCRVHGQFVQRALKHVHGAQGCPVCARFKKGDRSRGSSRGSAEAKLENNRVRFLKECQKVHGDLYDYAQTEYKGARNKVSIICRTHGVFEQTASKHLLGRGCQKCGKYVGRPKKE
jgi:hypothetical protein